MKFLSRVLGICMAQAKTREVTNTRKALEKENFKEIVSEEKSPSPSTSIKADAHVQVDPENQALITLTELRAKKKLQDETVERLQQKEIELLLEKEKESKKLIEIMEEDIHRVKTEMLKKEEALLQTILERKKDSDEKEKEFRETRRDLEAKIQRLQAALDLQKAQREEADHLKYVLMSKESETTTLKERLQTVEAELEGYKISRMDLRAAKKLTNRLNEALRYRSTAMQELESTRAQLAEANGKIEAFKAGEMDGQTENEVMKRLKETLAALEGEKRKNEKINQGLRELSDLAEKTKWYLDRKGQTHLRKLQRCLDGMTENC